MANTTHQLHAEEARSRAAVSGEGASLFTTAAEHFETAHRTKRHIDRLNDSIAGLQRSAAQARLKQRFGDIEQAEREIKELETAKQYAVAHADSWHDKGQAAFNAAHKLENPDPVEEPEEEKAEEATADEGSERRGKSRN